MGFFLNKQIALDVLHTTSTDMDEFCYDYAVIEKYYEGLLGVSTERQFFKYDKEKGGFCGSLFQSVSGIVRLVGLQIFFEKYRFVHTKNINLWYILYG